MSKSLLVSLVVLFAIFVRLFNLNQMGRTMDEDYIVEKGWKFVNMARHGDFSNPYWYSMPDHPPLANYLYGLVAERDVIGFNAHAISLDHAYQGVPIFAYDLTNSRLISVLLSSLTILLVCLLGWEYLSPFVGVTAGVILATIPFYLGLSQIVFLETTFMFFFTATVYSLLRLLKRPTIRAALVTGILCGCALQAKQPAILLFPLLLALYILKRRLTKLPDTKPRFIHFLYIFGAAYITYVLLWPMPWFHLPQFLEYTYKMWFTGGYGYPEVFRGKLVFTPIYYYGVYFLITIPVLLLVSFFLGVGSALLSKRWIVYALLLWFAIPFVGQSLFILRQHQLRYVVEIYAPFALIAAYGIEQTMKRFAALRGAKYLCLLLITIYMVAILWKSTPYYLDYFNELVGGTKHVYDTKSFQLGWGGQGEGAAGLYLAQHAAKGATVGLALDTIKNIRRADGLRFAMYDNRKQYDWVVVNYYDVIRDGFNEEPVKQKYKLVDTVFADGAELVHVYKRK